MNNIINLKYKNKNFDLKYKDLLKRCRIYNNDISDNIAHLLKQAVEIGTKLITPKYSCCEYNIKQKIETKIILENNFSLNYPRFFRFFKNCSTLSIITLTIGNNISNEINNLQKEDSISKAFFLDAFASEACEAFATYVDNYLKNKKVTHKGTPRFSPGFSDLPLSIQPDILKLSKAETIDVSCKDNSFFLLPEKSITALIGWEND